MQKIQQYIAALVVIVVVALYLISTVGPQPGNSLVSYDSQPVSQSLLSQLNISNDVGSAIGQGLATNLPRNVSAPPLQINGKPEILYIGANFCPFCAIERWGMVIALSRFGSLSGVEYMTSSAKDSYPNTPTFSFSNSTYSSKYIAFVAVETEGNKLNASNRYPILKEPNNTQYTIQQKWDPGLEIPFIDFANKSTQIGANYNDPTILANENWSTIANNIHNVSSVDAGALVGSANIFTAEICKIDGNTPQSICGQNYIKNIESQLK